MHRRRLLILTTLLVVVPLAHADIGVPMVAIFLPPMWLSLVPVVLLEAWVLSRTLALPKRTTLFASVVANLVTTVIGVPLIWLLFAIIESICCGSAHGLTTFSQKIYAVTVQAPWLIPYENDLAWMIPAALLVLAVPFFFITVAVEGEINRRLLSNSDPRRVWIATWRANAWSYAMLALLTWPALMLADQLGRFFGPLLEWFVAIVFGVAKGLHEHAL